MPRKPQPKKDPHRYEVIVGNIGKVYDGCYRFEADRAFQDYRAISRGKPGPHPPFGDGPEPGRAVGEEVTMLKDGALFLEHQPPVKVEA